MQGGDVSFSQFRSQLWTFNSLLRGSVLHDGTGQSGVTAVCAIPNRREPIAAAGGDGAFTPGGPYAHNYKQACKQQFMHVRALSCLHSCLQAREHDRLGLSGRVLHVDTHANQQVSLHAHKQTFKQTCELTCQLASLKVNMHACLQATMHTTTHANLLANMKGST